MDGETAAFIAGMIVAGIIGVLLSVGAFAHGTAAVKQEAVNANAAEWTVDKNGERGFRWLPAKPPEIAR